jgi:glyoxylase-like metal-dependent hydrolase (beta-lactamase superfamily II)
MRQKAAAGLPDSRPAGQFRSVLIYGRLMSLPTLGYRVAGGPRRPAEPIAIGVGMQGPQPPKGPVASHSTNGPEVLGFFHADTSSVSYVVVDPATRRAAIIDAVLDYDPKAGRTRTAFADAILATVAERKLTVDWVLETHVHADHLSAGAHCRDRLGSRLAIGANVTAVQAMVCEAFELAGELATDGSQFDHRFEADERFSIGGIAGRVMFTPGHTPACATYLIGDAAFVGDTLFMPDYGTARCDFPGGSAATLYGSIQRLLALPDATRLFTAHDYAPGGRPYAWETTVAAQRRDNLHVGGGISEAVFIERREARDKTLDAPVLILPSLQVNVRGGRLPKPTAKGRSFLKIPVNWL